LFIHIIINVSEVLNFLTQLPKRSRAFPSTLSSSHGIRDFAGRNVRPCFGVGHSCSLNTSLKALLQEDERKALLQEDERKALLQEDERKALLQEDERKALLQRDGLKALLQRDERKALLQNKEVNLWLMNRK
jgi:hypothetical protein